MVIDETMYEDEILEHHGIPGQKWGTKNGPPYPLDENVARKVMSKSKEEAMRSGKASEVDAFKFEMTNEELQRALNRIRLYNDLDKMKTKEINPNNKQKASTVDIVKSISNVSNTTKAILDTYINIKKLKDIRKTNKANKEKYENFNRKKKQIKKSIKKSSS